MRKVAWIPLVLALAVGIAALCRPSIRQTFRAKTAILVPPRAIEERLPTPEETARAVESSEVRSLMRRLKEATVLGDETTRDAMIVALKRHPARVREELASVSDPRVADALRRALE
jgi:hypothetical protein